MLTPTAAISDWKDLQEKVFRLFSEMDYIAEVSKKVPLAGRGEKEIDVFVTDPNASYNRFYLVECKFWESRVPQEVVHSFKTVMEETGANTGFIVSKIGFQRGATEAARFTNINLLTFDELQHAYGDEWFRKQQGKLDRQVLRLRQHHMLHFDQWNLLGIHNNKYFRTDEQLERFNHFHHWITLLLANSASIWPKTYEGPEPVRVAIDPANPEREFSGWFEFPTVRDYFSAMIGAVTKCADEFEAFVQDARCVFNGTPSDDQEVIHSRVLSSIREELPLRVFKRYINEVEYIRLLERVKTEEKAT